MPSSQTRSRIGVFGGSFDPIHLGHLLLAESAREQLALDEVRFIPAAQSPLKTHQAAGADGKQRAEMVGLAINGHPAFVLDERELKRGGTSYTVDTLRELSTELPDTELVFLMGADSLSEFHLWQAPAEICQLAQVVVLARGGHPEPAMNLLAIHLPSGNADSLEECCLPMPQVEISSSDLRHRLAAGRSTRYQLPPPVQAYIDARQLYRG